MEIGTEHRHEGSPVGRNALSVRACVCVLVIVGMYV